MNPGKTMRFLTVVRFDASDDHVYARTARPDEIAVPGAFEFSNLSEQALTGKVRQAFSNGFLGLESFGRATFTSVSEITGTEFERMIENLSRHFVDVYGAPDSQSAENFARQEAAFVEDLCKDNLLNTIFAVSRTLDEGGIHEEFRIIKPPADGIHTPIWTVVEDKD